MASARKDGVPLEKRTLGGRSPSWRSGFSVEAVFSEGGISEPTEYHGGDFRNKRTLEEFFGDGLYRQSAE